MGFEYGDRDASDALPLRAAAVQERSWQGGEYDGGAVPVPDHPITFNSLVNHDTSFTATVQGLPESDTSSIVSPPPRCLNPTTCPRLSSAKGFSCAAARISRTAEW